VTDLPDRILVAIELRKQLATEHHLGMCTIWTEGYRLNPGPCNCRGPAEVRRTCEADKRTVERHAPTAYECGLHDCVTHGHLLTCNGCGEMWPCPDLLDRAAAYGVPTTPIGETT
jgi:hypothetical protein